MSTPRPDLDIAQVLRELQNDAPPTRERRQQLVDLVRTHPRGGNVALDVFFFAEFDRMREGLNRAREIQRELRVVVEKLSQPPWHPATFLSAFDVGGFQRAVVACGAARRVVGVAEGVSLEAVATGDEVLLSEQMNAIVSTAPQPAQSSGELATFERYTEDGRLILTSRGEEVVVDGAAALAAGAMRTGDLVRWSRQSWMAYEKVEKSASSALFLEETPSDSFDDIGGLDEGIDRVKETIRLHFERPDLALRYDVRPPKSLLLVGPPGTGKTMIARALARWLGTLSASGRSRFMNIPPAGLHSMWYSQSEANYREAFRAARETAATDPEIPVVMFFDEVDAIGAARGASVLHVDDRVLNAFMTELDGMTPRGNVLVVAATNRLAALDPALVRPGRLGDLRLTIPRPRLAAARAILAKHLPARLPYDGADQSAAREEMLDAAIGRLYAPNGGTAVATLTFRDGKRRVVEARDLVNGAVLANIGRSARASAWARESETGASGLRTSDVLAAVDQSIVEMTAVLSAANCRNHLSDLPEDVDVVRVDPVERKSARTHRYMRVA